MKNKKSILISFFVVGIFVVVGFFLVNQPAKTFHQPNPAPKLEPQNIKYVKIAGQNIKVDLALTPAQQSQGLSGRTGLGTDEGMLFIFDKPGIYPFWMKDMNFPIDIIWMDENLQVVYIKKDARPELYPETYEPDTNIKYVLEVPSGFSENNNLKEGGKAELVY